MKKCKKCEGEYDESEFYKGHAKCKKCYIELVKCYAENNKEKIKEYEASRAMLPHRVKARAIYQKTEAGKESIKKSKEKWQESNLIKKAASTIVGNAVRDGKIMKKYSCEECGATDKRIHGHHDDYCYPMIVRWLCPKCHNKWHKENGSGMNG